MDFIYQSENLPKLEIFNKVKINYLETNSLSKNCQNSTHIINQNLILSNDLIPLITSYFNCNPTIYGTINYHYLDSILELKIPLTQDIKSETYYLNHNLSNYTPVFDNYRGSEISNPKFNHYKRDLIKQNILENKMIYCYHQHNKSEIQILKKYHNIEKFFVMEWKLLPYLSLFITNKIQEKNSSNTFTFNNNITENFCQIYFEIDKMEKIKLIEAHPIYIHNH